MSLPHPGDPPPPRPPSTVPPNAPHTNADDGLGVQQRLVLWFHQLESLILQLEQQILSLQTQEAGLSGALVGDLCLLRLRGHWPPLGRDRADLAVRPPTCRP